MALRIKFAVDVLLEERFCTVSQHEHTDASKMASGNSNTHSVRKG